MFKDNFSNHHVITLVITWFNTKYSRNLWTICNHDTNMYKIHYISGSMVLIIDVNSELHAQARSNFCYLICLCHQILSYHLIKSTMDTTMTLPRKKNILIHYISGSKPILTHIQIQCGNSRHISCYGYLKIPNGRVYKY